MVDYQAMIVPSAEHDWAEYPETLELAREPKGKLFKKHLLTKGELIYKDKKLGVTHKVQVDDDFFNTVKKNFDNQVVGIVQVPVAGKKNEHTHSPWDNVGEVVELAIENDKLYAIVDIRDKTAQEKISDKTFLGGSAYIELEHENTKTGENVGPTLVHSLVTNYPYIPDLEDYKEVIAASSDSIDKVAVFAASSDADEKETDRVVIDTVEPPKAPEPKEPTMAEEEKPKAQDELLAELKEKHGIDVTALQELAKEVEDLKAQLAANDKPVEDEEAKAKDEKIAELEAKVAASAQTEALTAALSKALAEVGVISLSNSTDEEDEVTLEDAVNGVAELANTVVALSSSVETLQLANQKLEHERAEAEIDALIGEGMILPVKKDVMLKLRLSNEEMFRELLPPEPIVKLSNEVGQTPSNDDQEKVTQEAYVNSILARHGRLNNNNSQSN